MSLQKQLDEILWELCVIMSPSVELSEEIKTLTRKMGRDNLLTELRRIVLDDSNNYAYGATKLLRTLQSDLT